MADVHSGKENGLVTGNGKHDVKADGKANVPVTATARRVLNGRTAEVAEDAPASNDSQSAEVSPSDSCIADAWVCRQV